MESRLRTREDHVLCFELEGNKIERGDLAQIELVVSVLQEFATPCLCFDSMALKLERMTQKGGFWERRKMHAAALCIVNRCQLANELIDFNGFAYMRAQIRSTEIYLKMTVKLASLKLFPIEEFPLECVPRSEDPDKAFVQSRGRFLARKVLTEAHEAPCPPRLRQKKFSLTS